MPRSKKKSDKNDLTAETKNAIKALVQTSSGVSITFDGSNWKIEGSSPAQYKELKKLLTQ